MLYTPLRDAVSILHQRRSETAVLNVVRSSLFGDIPDYLDHRICLVLPRHIATPNNETLATERAAKSVGGVSIFSQDSRDYFTSVNVLKRRLAVPEIARIDNGVSDGRFVYDKIALINASVAEGRRICDVATFGGNSLIDFHNSLFSHHENSDCVLADDADWIDRNGRGDIFELYRRYLLLFLAHGILVDDFESSSDRRFKQQVILPAVKSIEAEYQLSPIIVSVASLDGHRGNRFSLAHFEKEPHTEHIRKGERLAANGIG